MIRIHIYEINQHIKQQSKVLLQNNLAHYLKRDSSEITLKYNKNGKPSIAGIHFSVSHSNNKLVQAFSQDSVLGIDIEYQNPSRKYLSLAKRYFHAQEYSYLKSLDKNQALSFFYNLWTCKEAVCKAQGGRLWYYLSENYLSNNNHILRAFKGLNIMQADTIKNYSLSVATLTESDVIYVYE